jgi:tRNA-specific 2-thiouridylase
MSGNSEKKKIFVGMSGGVDSSVSAALLKEAGHEVVGVFIKVWQADFLPCNWREERREAMRAAAHLNIPFLTLDLEKEYKTEVVDYMIREYSAGRVPNPDVMCNKYVKFGAFLDFAIEEGADAIATGHYARIGYIPRVPLEYKLLAGVDPEKDQSYFLWTLGERELSHTFFPVGGMKKSEVRTLAEKFGLPNAQKKDSQGLCFVGKVNMYDFLKHFVNAVPGPVLDEEAKVIGEHDGAMLYTIGQRQGFRIHAIKANMLPYFVMSKDMAANTITVGEREQKDVSVKGAPSAVLLESLHTTTGRKLVGDEGYEAQVRYHGERHPISIEEQEGKFIIRFQNPKERFIAPGQSLVVYRGEECLGGGVIAQLLEV